MGRGGETLEPMCERALRDAVDAIGGAVMWLRHAARAAPARGR